MIMAKFMLIILLMLSIMMMHMHGYAYEWGKYYDPEYESGFACLVSRA